MAAPVSIRFSTDFDPHHGEAVTIAPGIARVTAANASPYTFTGTNSYLLGHDRVLLVDPGPRRKDHLDALRRAVAGRPVDGIVLTHTHRDHSDLARQARDLFKAPILSAGPHRLFRPLRRFEFNPFARSGDFSLVPDQRIEEGDILQADDAQWTVRATPGHCLNHIALFDGAGMIALVGDHVMGWSSTLVAAADGDLRAYLKSLALMMEQDHTLYLPGHGGAIRHGPEHAHALREHRLARNAQILDALSQGHDTPAALRRRLYPELRGGQAFAARQTIVAHLEYLQSEGDVHLDHGVMRTRATLVR